MSTNRDQRPLVIQKVKLRWWGVSIVPILLGLYIASLGYLPTAIAMLAVFCLIFWLISFIVALVILVTNRQPKGPRQ